MELTAAQERYLSEIREAGPLGRAYNGRANRPLKTLESLGLIEVEWDMEAHAKGSGIELVWRNTARPKGSTS